MSLHSQGGSRSPPQKKGIRDAGRRKRGVCITKTEKAESEAQKGVNLKESARRAILVWECRDRSPRRSVGKGASTVLLCFHAVTIQQRGRATRSIDHDTHGHRLGQERRWVLLKIPRCDIEVVLLKKQKTLFREIRNKVSFLNEHSRRSSGGGASYAAPRRGVVSVACDDVSCMVE